MKICHEHECVVASLISIWVYLCDAFHVFVRIYRVVFELLKICKKFHTFVFISNDFYFRWYSNPIHESLLSSPMRFFFNMCFARFYASNFKLFMHSIFIILLIFTMDVQCGKDDAMQTQRHYSKNATEIIVSENLGCWCICPSTKLRLCTHICVWADERH